MSSSRVAIVASAGASAPARIYNIDTTQVWNDLVSSSAGTTVDGLSEVMSHDL